MKKIIASLAIVAGMFSAGLTVANAAANCVTGVPHTALTVGGAKATLANGNPAGWARGFSNITQGRNANLLWADKAVWGNVILQSQHKYRFVFKATTAGWHPAATVWWRDGVNTAPLTTIAAPLYDQDVYVGPVDCNGDGSAMVAQYFVKTGYDTDGMVNPLPNPAYAAAHMVGKSDGVPGQLSLTFTAQRDGNFEFAASGYNPDSVKNGALFGNMTVEITEVP